MIEIRLIQLTVFVSLISFLLSLAKLSRLDSFHEYLIKTQLSDKSKGDIYLISSIEIISQYLPEIIRKLENQHTTPIKGKLVLLGLNRFDILISTNVNIENIFASTEGCTFFQFKGFL